MIGDVVCNLNYWIYRGMQRDFLKVYSMQVTRWIL